MSRTVPISATQVAGNLITGALWNAGPAASNTFLTTVPLAEVYQTISQTLSNGTWTAISQDSTVLDTDGQHSGSINNSRFTCQVAGWYTVAGAVAFNANSTGSRAADIYRNGSPLLIASGAITAASNAIHVAVAAGLGLQLAVGDYLELYGWQNSGGNVTTAVGTQYSSFLYARWDHA
jgi:hypothetical protein